MSVTVIPTVAFYLWQSVRAGSMAFFTAVNPGIYMAGLYGTPKSDINKLIPPQHLPWSLLMPRENKDVHAALSQINASGITFPIIAKPNVGERGLNVHKVDSESDLNDILQYIEGDVLLQEYISYELEITVLCHNMPELNSKSITSVCTKEFLTVTGDGVLTVGELIQRKPRAILQLKRLESKLDMDLVPDIGEVIILEPIGNHNRGTRFINGNHLISEELEGVFLPLILNMPGVTFGRFDIRARSIEDLERGTHFKVLEFNGVNAEPVHIYDPEYPVWKSYRDLWRQWQLLRRIATKQRELGVRYRTTSESWRAFRDYLAYKRRATLNL